jgi:hypothetical protein
MLTKLDETLRHQLPTTFDHVGTSDPRFYDRYFFGVHDPGGSMVVHLGIGLYSNMNVMDGYVAVQTPIGGGGGALQHNVRVSRALRPDIDTVAVGPLRIDVLEPFERARIVCEPGDLPIAVDLDWRSRYAPTEEDHHFTRLRGRVTSDYRRYTQLGVASGTVTVDGQAHTVNDWFSPRDHSWGVRQQVAGPEPVTGPAGWGTESFGFVFFWLPFDCGDIGGHVQVQMLGDGTVRYRNGELFRADGSVDPVVDVRLDADFHDGTRAFSEIRAKVQTSSGESHDITVTPLLRGFSMDGTGYDWGWDDGQGLGVYRGEYYSEADVYDLTHPETVRRPDGDERRPMHRETPARVNVDGAVGTGHQVFVVTGPVPFLGLE